MRLRVDVSKNFSTAESSQDGEFDTSTTTEAPFSTSASPSPVRVLTPVLGAAATASCPCSRSLLTSFDPMSPVPPITTIFMIVTFLRDHAFLNPIGLFYALRQYIPALCDTTLIRPGFFAIHRTVRSSIGRPLTRLCSRARIARRSRGGSCRGWSRAYLRRADNTSRQIVASSSVGGKR